MLSDIERKVLMIIKSDLLLARRAPTVRELRIRTGRTKGGVYEVLRSLNRKGYIRWDPRQPDVLLMVQDAEPQGHWKYD